MGNSTWWNKITKELDGVERMGNEYAISPENFLDKPCWCGSNFPLALCHGRLSLEEPISRNDFLKIWKKAWKPKGTCMYKTCDKESIASHSLARMWLAKMTDTSKVFRLQREMFNEDGLISPVEEGVNEASRFGGFCEEHDNKVFEEIESEEEWSITPDNCLKCYYRCVCFELYAKRVSEGVNEKLKFLLTKGKEPNTQVKIFLDLQQLLLGIKKGISDLEALKIQCEGLLDGGLSSNFSYAYIPITQNKRVMVSGMHAPLLDFKGREIQSLKDDIIISTSLLIAKNGGEGFCLFAGFNENTNLCKNFIESVIISDQLEKRIPLYALETTETFFWNIDDWNSLSTNTRNEIFRILSDSVEKDIYKYCEETPLDLDFGWNYNKKKIQHNV